MSDRRSFVRELLGLVAGLLAIARGVKEVAEAPTDADVDRQVDARYTALQWGQPDDPRSLEYSLDGATWEKVSLAPETLCAIGAGAAMAMGHHAARRRILERQLGGLPFPSSGAYLLRATEYFPRTQCTRLWLMQCRDGHVYGWRSCGYAESYLAGVGLPAAWREVERFA